MDSEVVVFCLPEPWSGYFIKGYILIDQFIEQFVCEANTDYGNKCLYHVTSGVSSVGIEGGLV